MSEEIWLDVISRITTEAPIDLDAVVFANTAVKPPRTVVVPVQDQAGPSTVIWDKTDPESSFIGIRVDTPLTDCTQAAFRLAAAALERGVTPIILTRLTDCGFERFGFRIERIIGDSDADCARLEADITKFWNLAIVIDVRDVAAFG